MAVVRVLGPGGFDLLQWCFTRNLHACVGKDNAPISPGKCVYGAFLDEHGHAIDDSIVYKVADEEYVVVVNAGMGGAIAAASSDARARRSATRSASASSLPAMSRGSCAYIQRPTSETDIATITKSNPNRASSL